MPPGNPLEFWHQSTSTGGPIPVSRTSSLRPLLRMLRFTTAGQGERRRCVRQSMSRNSERTLQQRQRWAGKITDHYRLWNSEKSCACLFTNTNHRHRISYCVSSEQRQSNPISLGWWILVFLFLTCPMGKWSCFGVLKLQKNCNQCFSSTLFSGLVQMTLWLVHASYSLLDRQAVKLTFFARVLRPSSRWGRAAFFHSLPLPVACS